MKQTKFTVSLSAFVSAAKRDNANKVLEALGFGPDSFSVPLRTTKAGVVKKYGLHAADDGRMRDVLNGTAPVPPGIVWSDYGLTKVQARRAIMSVRTKPRPRRSKMGSVDFDEEATTQNVKRAKRRGRTRASGIRRVP